MQIGSVILDRQIEIYTAELLVGFCHFEIIAKLKMYKSPGFDQIRAQLIQAGCEILSSIG
jgi:hypothetical protein